MSLTEPPHSRTTPRGPRGAVACRREIAGRVIAPWTRRRADTDLRGYGAVVRVRFDGWILGVGTSSGTRVVVGHWPRSPFGPLSDVMVEQPDGHRLLLAPQREVAEFIAATYTFDEVALVPVTVGRPDPATWAVTAGPLDLRARTGRRPPVGWLLHAVPARLATAPAWVDLVELPARLAGMHTSGTAGNGRTEWYGVRDLHTVTDLSATWFGTPLGGLAPIRPPVTFGFASIPRTPSLTRLATTIGIPS